MTTFSPSKKNLPADRPSTQLRTRAACTLVKKRLLGSRHVAFEAQKTAMAKALGPDFRDSHRAVSKETWAAWWEGEQSPKDQNRLMLDRAFGKPSGYISALLDGKPFRESLQQSESSIHLHFEALDAAACAGMESRMAQSQCEEKAFRVLRTLHKKWRPSRHRQVPGAFPLSRTRVEYDAARNDTDRTAIRARFPERFKPSLFELSLNQPDRLAVETCERYDALSPASMGAFLLAVGYDTEFLSEEKIQEWAWDLSTVSLAVCALLLSQPAYFLTGQDLAYAGFWDKVHTLFWFSDQAADDQDDYEFVLDRLGLWEPAGSEQVCYNFCRAREAYGIDLQGLGLSRTDVEAVLTEGALGRAQPSTVA